MEEKIKEALCAIIHPETGEDIVKSGFVEQISVEREKIVVTLHFTKRRDPFAVKIKNQVEAALRVRFPSKNILVIVKEGRAVAALRQAQRPPLPGHKEQTTTGKISKVIAIASGKGGVGKSTVTANLAVTLRNMGFSVGVLDADIYGPSQPKMFGVEDYIPEAQHMGGIDRIIPAEAMGIKIISIGFFVTPHDALLWRGVMATNALKQLIHQTDWGVLDFLLVDLPPGTGDIHLSIINELKIDAAVIVSTPQKIAVADVARGVELFRNKNVDIPIAGIIENMAWFSPEEASDNRYYLFGRGGVRRFAEECGVDFLGEIPIVRSIMESSDEGRPAAGIDERVGVWYREICQKVVDKVLEKR